MDPDPNSERTIIAETTFMTHLDNGKCIKLTVNAYANKIDKHIDYTIITSTPPILGEKLSGHPFALSKPNHNSDGLTWMMETVADNSMMRELFRYIAMDDSELEKHCGNISRAFYRSQLIRMLEFMTDDYDEFTTH